MFLSLRITRAPSMRIDCSEPLSKTTISRSGTLWLRIESMHARSISPPPVASSTMQSMSLMIHPIEIHRALQATQLDTSAPRHIHANLRVPSRGREGVGVGAELNQRRRAGSILNRRWTAPRQKAHRVAG